MIRRGRSYCFIDLAELFEMRTKSLVVGVPCEAAAIWLDVW